MTDKPAEVTDKPTRGGRRPTPQQARFTAQLIAMVTQDTRDRVDKLTEDHGVSQSRLMRAIIAAGTPVVEKNLQSGRLDPQSLV
jgi:hypothetical protein